MLSGKFCRQAEDYEVHGNFGKLQKDTQKKRNGLDIVALFTGKINLERLVIKLQ